MSITLNNCSASHSRLLFPVKTTMFRPTKMASLLRPSNVFSLLRGVSLSTTTVASFKSNNLFSRISPIRKSSQVIPLLDQWVQEGRKVQKPELQRIIRDLRGRKRYSHALEVSEWMSLTGLCSFSPGDCAVHLDLIGVLNGCNAAESYFDSLKLQLKNEKTYGALLNCYVREGLIDKCLMHVQKMQEIGYGSSTLVYNNLMNLYKQAGQLDKVTDMMAEMKKKDLLPNNFSYRICITCSAMKSDITSLEKLLEEMENQNHISMDWITYSIVANFYIKANLMDKAILCLKKLEHTLHKDAVGYNHLISLYAQLGNIDEMMRLWRFQKVVCKKHINRDYITMIGSLVKLGELEKAEAQLEEWESSCHIYDIRVPNILLIGYCQRDLVEKAETMLRNIIKKGIVPTPNSWSIIAAGYMNKEDMEKALDCMKEAFQVRETNPKWIPKPELVSKILIWLANQGSAEEMEAFMSLMHRVMPVITRTGEVSTETNGLDGGNADWNSMSLKADILQEHEEIENVLCLR